MGVLILLMGAFLLLPRALPAAPPLPPQDDLSVPASSSLPLQTTKDALHSNGSVLDNQLGTRDSGQRPLKAMQTKLLQARFEKVKSEAAEVATLAEQLRQKLNLPGADAHSAEIVSLADKIEKLAKKIRSENRGF